GGIHYSGESDCFGCGSYVCYLNRLDARRIARLLGHVIRCPRPVWAVERISEGAVLRKNELQLDVDLRRSHRCGPEPITAREEFQDYCGGQSAPGLPPDGKIR